ncbi:LysM peptidoglycan-binding domain-containing protein [Bacillus sp. 1NLA3E]|uniref:LysM peptidoglycan-binding domain-containing protein n=1 Tax=Bacillus sp. 1NLA3E TaxID=666686 RepID=UPI000247E331|nr:LysM peptidoglycan-binding domain-containing protein [Bacillus sp. 1NLA3E]AGK54738.1 peptidoglycan-binding LysM [Bacillus sp. 1NLA3E]
MNKEDPYRQKTDSTRLRVDRPVRVDHSNIERKVDETSLPPRGEHHQQRRSRKKTQGKQSFPLIRLLVLFFILLPVTIYAVYNYRDVIFPHQNKQVFEEKGGYERISIDHSDSKKKASKETTKKEKDDTTTVKDNTTSSTVTETAQAETVTTETTPAENTNVSDATSTGNVSTGNVAPPPVQNDSTETKQPTNTVEFKQHTVKTGETLYRIAMNYYHSQSGIEIIKQANHMNNNEIHVGQVLKIPIQK